MRRHLNFECKGDRLVGTLDEAGGKTGLFIVSGGNEIRSGAHRGQAMVAQILAEQGFPTFRFDRRGIGDSEGANLGFEQSADDIAAALACFRKEAQIDRIIAFGNCDAATALALHTKPGDVDGFILSNPWVIEETSGVTHSPKQLRQRYLAKLRSPIAIWQFLTSATDFKKLGAGLKTAASASPAPAPLAEKMLAALDDFSGDVHFFIASRDRTAQIFAESLDGPAYRSLRQSDCCHVHICDTNGHSYAGATDQQWLTDNILAIVKGR